MYKYYIRVDKNEGYDEGISMLESMCQKCLGVYHTGKSQDNPHWHFAIECDVKNIPCLRARLRKFWSVAKSISIKNFDGNEKGLKYLFHEKDRESFSVVSQKGYNEDVIKSLKEDSVSKSPKENVKKRVPTFTQKLVEAALDKFKSGNLWKTYENDEAAPRREVLKFVIKFFGGQHKVFDKFVINRAFNVVCFHLYGDEFIEDFTDICLMQQ